MKKSIIISLAISLIINGCTTTDCISDGLRFNLINFTDQEASIIILRKYSKSSNFNALLDTAKLTMGFARFGDTLQVVSRTGNTQITAEYDYEIVFPVAAKTYGLTEIVEKKSESRKSIFKNTKEICVNSITNFKLNGVSMVPDWSNSFYLRK